MSEEISPSDATAMVHLAVPAMARLGLAVEEISPGYVRLRMPLEPNRNHLGTMYAGALFAIAELPGGLLPMSIPVDGVVPIVAHVDIDFLRAARSDVTLEASLAPSALLELAERARAVGKAEFTLELAITDDQSRVVATSTGHYQLRPVRS